MATASNQTNWLVQIFDPTGKLADVPQADIVSVQLSDGLNGGSGAGGSDQIVFARPYNKIGAVGFGYTVLVWFWAKGTTRPADPYYGGHIVDFDQAENDASGRVTAYLEGDSKLLDAAIVTESIAPSTGTNQPMDAAAYIGYLLKTYSASAQFATPSLPATMFALQPTQFDATKLGAAIDTITKQGRDSTGLLYTWFVRTKHDLTRRVVVQADQNPNNAAIAATGVRMKVLFRGSQIRNYKIQTKYRDIVNMVAIYGGGTDPATGHPPYGVFFDPVSSAQPPSGYGPIQEKLSVPALLTNAACAAYASVYFDLHAYPQAQGSFEIIAPDPSIVAGTWLQINETPATGAAQAQQAVVKQIRSALVQIQISGERVTQTVQTVSPTPYLDSAIYRMGLNVQAQMQTAIRGLSVNRQTLFVRSGGYVTATASSPAQVALAPTDAVFPAASGSGAVLVSAPALGLTTMTDTTGAGSPTNGQTGDGPYTISLKPSGAYVVTKGPTPPNAPGQQNLVTAVVVNGVPFTNDVRTLYSLPLMPAATQSAGPQAISALPVTPSYPNLGAGTAGKSTFDALVTVTLGAEATKSSPWLVKLELLASPQNATNATPVLIDRVDPNPTSGAYAFLYGQLGTGTAWDLWVRYSDGVLSSAPLKLGTTAAQPLTVGVGNVNYGAHPLPQVTSSTLATGVTGNSVHAQVDATVTLSNVPTDGSPGGAVGALAFFYQLHQGGSLKPIGDVALTPNQPTQTVALGFEVGAGQTIDVFVAYAGIASGDYGPHAQIGSTSQIQNGFMPATLVVTGAYLAGTTAVPSLSSPASLTPRDATAGVSSTVTAVAPINDQPQDGSLGKIVWWYRKSGDTVWSFAGRLAAKGAGTPNPPAAWTYTYDYVDLSNGLVYEFGVSFESVNQAEGAVLSLGTATAPNVVIGTSKLRTMPAAVAASGPTLVASPSVASTIAHAGGSGVDLVTFTFSFTETNISDWCSAVVVLMREVATGQNVGLPNYLAPIASNTGYAGAVAVPAGHTVSIGFCYLDQSGAASATTWGPSVVGNAIGTTYLANGAAVAAPAVSGAHFTPTASANGISGGMEITFAITNQPVDGSLYEITLERRITGSGGVYEKYVDVPAASLGSSTGNYDFTALDLSNGQAYDWQVKFRSVQGQTSPPTYLGTSVAAPVNISTGALPKIPNGTSVAVTSFNLPAGSYSGVGGASVHVTPTFTITITPPGGDNRPYSQWGAGLAYWAKVTASGASDGDTNVLDYFSVGTYSGSTLPTTDTLGPLGSGNAYQLAVQPLDQQGNGGPLAVMGVTTVQTQGTPSFSGMPATIKTNGPSISVASLGPRSNPLGVIRSASVSFTETDFTAKPGWLADIILTVRMNGDTDGGQQVRIDPGSSTNGHYAKSISTAIGDSIDIGISYVDTQGNASAIVWPAGLSAQTDPNGGVIDPGSGKGGIVHNRMSIATQTVVGLDGAAPFATKGQNLVANGDLSLYTPPTGVQSTYAHTVRTNDPGSVTPTGWTRNFVGGSEGTLNQYIVPSGQSVPAGPSLVLNDKPAGGAVFAAISDAFPVKPSAQYVFLADVFAGYNTGPLPANASWYMRVWFYKPGTTDFSRYSPTVAAGTIAYTADDGTTGTSALGYFDVILGSTSTVGRTYRGVATVPSDAAFCRISVKHDGSATVPWNLLVQNVRCYEGNIDHATMSPGVQSAVAPTGNLLASDFPGQTVHQTTGAYAGWELVTGSLLGGTGCKDVHGAPVSGTMLWSEWTAILPSPTVSYGPVFVDADGTGLLGILAVGGAGNVYATQGAGKTIGIPANVAANSANNGLAHTFRMGIAYVSGANPSATWHLIGYIDGAKVFDQNVVANFNNTQAYAGFASGAGTPMYVRDFKWSVGNDSLEKAPVQVTTTIGSVADTNGSYLNSNQISGRHLRGGSPTATGDLLDINDAGGSGTNFRHARMSRTLTYANRRVISVAGKMPYVSAGVLNFPSTVQVNRSADAVNIPASTTIATAASSYIFVNMTTAALSSVLYTAAAANLDDPNYECIGYVDGNTWAFSPLGWANGDHLSAMQDVIGAVGGGVGDFHVGKARAGTLLPLTNHAQTIQNRNGIGAVVAGQMPYVDGSNVLHFPSTVIMYRPDGSFCRVAAGTVVSLVAASGFAGIFLTWISAGNGAVIAINNGVAGAAGTGYAATLQSTSYELLGTSSGDSSPASFSPAFNNANTAAASYDVIGDNRDGSGNFHAGKARGGTLLPLPNHHPSVQLDATGSQVNLVPDSDLQFGAAYWSPAQSTGTVHYAISPNLGRNCFLANAGATPGTVNFNLSNISGSKPGLITALSSGIPYTLSAMIDMIGSQGSVALIAMRGDTNTEVARISQTAASQSASGSRAVNSGFVLPAGCSSLYFLLQVGLTGANQSAWVGQIQFETGSTATGYKGNDANHQTGYFERLVHHPDFRNSINTGGGLVFNYGTHVGTLPHVNHSAGVQAALNPNGDLIGPVDVPGLTYVSSGTWRGNYRLDVPAYTVSWASANGALGTNQWHTFECSMNGDTGTNWGPAMMDQNGAGFLVDCVSGTVLALHTRIGGTWNRVQDYSFNAQDSRWHRFTMKVVWTGSVVRAVCFIDGVKSHDYSTAAFNAAGLFQVSPAFYNDAPGHAYVRPQWLFAHNGESPFMSSTPLNSQGSLAYIAQPTVSSSGSGQSCTINVTGSVVYPDGSMTSVSGNLTPPNNGALGYSTTYYFSVRVNLSTNLPEIGDWQTSPLSAGQVEKCYYDGYIPLSTSSSFTTAASSGGTGGGSGGGGKINQCPAVNQPVETLESGIVPAGRIEKGMHVLGQDGAWVRVYAAYDGKAELVRITVEDEDYDVEWQHLWLMPDGEWIESCKLGLGTLVTASDGSAKRVRKIESLGPGTYRKLRVRGGIFRMGAMIAHNIITY